MIETKSLPHTSNLATLATHNVIVIGLTSAHVKALKYGKNSALYLIMNT